MKKIMISILILLILTIIGFIVPYILYSIFNGTFVITDWKEYKETGMVACAIATFTSLFVGVILGVLYLVADFKL